MYPLQYGVSKTDTGEIRIPDSAKRCHHQQAVQVEIHLVLAASLGL